MADEYNPYGNYDTGGESPYELLRYLKMNQNRISSTISNVQRDGDDLREKQSQITQTIDSIELDVLDIQNVNGTHSTKIGNLEVRADGIDLTVSSIQESVTGNTSKIGSIEIDVDAVTTKVASVEDTATTNSTKVGQLEVRAESIELSVTSVTTKAGQNETKIGNLEVRADGIEASVSSVTETTSSLTTRITGAEGTIQDLTGTTETHTSKISQLEIDVDSINLTVASSEESITTLEGTVSTLEGEVTSLEGVTTGQATQIGTIHTTIETHTNKISQLELDVDSINLSVSSVETSVTTIQTDLSGVQTDVSGAESNISGLQGDVSGLQGDVSTLDGVTTTHTTKIGQLEVRANSIELNVSSLQSTTNNLGTTVSQHTSSIELLETQITSKVSSETFTQTIDTLEKKRVEGTTAPTDTSVIWIDTSVTPKLPKVYIGGSWQKLAPTTASEVGAPSTSSFNSLATRVTNAESSITQNATSITSKVSKTYVDNEIYRVDGDIYDLGQRTSSAESTISQQASQISLRVKTEDYTGNTLVSMINQSATTIDIAASKINLIGAVSVLSDISGNLGTITAGSLNLSTNATIGNYLYLGNLSTGTEKRIYFNSAANISGGSGFANMELNAESLYMRGDYNYLDGIRTYIRDNYEPESETSETGYCGTSTWVDNNSRTGQVSGQGVNFKYKRRYTPSSVSFSQDNSTVSPHYTNLSREGFYLYLNGEARADLYMWRGRYSIS